MHIFPTPNPRPKAGEIKFMRFFCPLAGKKTAF